VSALRARGDVKLLAVKATPRIVIQPYNVGWPGEFARLEAALGGALGDVAERVDHIGSTSVPGLAAKDVIDVQISVWDLTDPRLVSALERLGASANDITSDHVPPGDQSKPSAWEKRYFRPPPSWRPTHLHVRETGRANTRYALLFRDYLRHSAAAAAAYAQIKMTLAQLHPEDVDAYYAVKDPVCDLIKDAAEQWAKTSRWSP
jgi:GrpB-like predicted nucleotidyltransferase (UPF0157 family)